MPKDGSVTRNRILDAAQAIVMRQGFAGASVDAITAEAGVTKGAFFHHFDSKLALGRELVRRYADADIDHLETFMARAERLARDPFEQTLVFLGLLEETVEGLQTEPGCLYASYCYEEQMHDPETQAVVAEAIGRWRGRFGDKLRDAAAAHPPRIEVDLDAVVDLYWAVFEGSFVLARASCDPGVVVRQLRQYRNYLELLFAAGSDSATVAP